MSLRVSGSLSHVCVERACGCGLLLLSAIDAALSLKKPWQICGTWHMLLYGACTVGFPFEFVLHQRIPLVPPAVQDASFAIELIEATQVCWHVSLRASHFTLHAKQHHATASCAAASVDLRSPLNHTH